MGKKIVGFVPGESETDDVVRRWLERNGIDQNLVSGYSIFRHQGEIPRIMLEMYFADPPLATGGVLTEPLDVSRETRAKVQPYLVGESGPEIVVTHPGAPAPTLADQLRAIHEHGEHAKGKNSACPLCYPPYDASHPDHRADPRDSAPGY